MGLTIANAERFTTGNETFMQADITFDATHPAGGEQMVADDFAALGMRDKADINYFSSELHSSQGRHVSYDRANGKLLVYDGGVEDTGDLSTFTAVCRFHKKAFNV